MPAHHSEKNTLPADRSDSAEKIVLDFTPPPVSPPVRALEIAADLALFLILGGIFSCVVVWDYVSSRARNMWERVNALRGVVDGRGYVPDERIPAWLAAEKKAREWAKQVGVTANPGTLISCHDCPFRIIEDSSGDIRTASGGWGSPEEQEAHVRTANAYRVQNTLMPVCGHPANGKWGEARYGARTPDVASCPRALLAKMNPIRRAFWQWRMKRHIKKHGATPKML